jgi:hypothetical protein
MLRIAFALLEESIRNNLDWPVLDRALGACRRNLEDKLVLGHAGVTISEELLRQKEQQIQILKMVAGVVDPSAPSEDALALFQDPEKLQFLSLTNLIKLFVRCDQSAVDDVLPALLKLLPDSMRKHPTELPHLAKVFPLITSPLTDESVTNLLAIHKILVDHEDSCNLVFAASLAIARASPDYPENVKKMSAIHAQLGKLSACDHQNGLFLEYLLDALLPRAADFEKDLTAAFSCYFADVPLMTSSHHSKLHLRCSRFVQPFYEHVSRLDDRGQGSASLFPAYLGLWKHWRQGCGCIESIDGWRMYQVLKKRLPQLARAQLPEGYKPQTVLEDLLRNDPEERTESKVALAKVLIRSYVTTTEPNEENLLEAIRILSAGSLTDDRLRLIHAIALALRNDDPGLTANYFTQLQPFADPKPECRRLYWTMRMLTETGADQAAIPYARQALTLLDSSLPTDFLFPLVSLAAYLLQDRGTLQRLVDMSGKTKISSPHPFLSLARLSLPGPAFKLMSGLVRTTAMPVTNISAFDFKPPFLMARSDDVPRVRNEVLQLFVDSPIASGNCVKLFFLFNPTKKVDQKVSRVLTKSRVLFGVDRLLIFEPYVRELTDLVAKKAEKGSIESALMDRALDSLVRGSQLEVSAAMRG